MSFHGIATGAERPRWLLLHPDLFGHLGGLSPSARLVFLFVCAHAAGRVNPIAGGAPWGAVLSYEEIAAGTGLSRSTAKRMVRRLVDRKFIERRFGGERRVAVYFLGRSIYAKLIWGHGGPFRGPAVPAGVNGERARVK